MPKLLESTTAKTEGAFYLRPLRSMVTTRKPKSLVDVSTSDEEIRDPCSASAYLDVFSAT